MLRNLSVENYALIDRLEMSLGPGLNIITGETGAGKSILLGALGLLLGTRGEAGVQKDPARNCVVEGIFELKGYGLEPFFAENDLEYSGQTTIRRVISAGKSRAYVNDLPVGLTVLRELGQRLIDIHSQHENLLLKDDRFRTSIIDGVAGQGALVKQYGEAYFEWKNLVHQLDIAREEARSMSRDEDYVRHQANELAAANLRLGEQEELQAEERELAHADEIREALDACAGELGAYENRYSNTSASGILPRLKMLRSAIDKIAKIHPRAEEFSARLNSAYIDLQDLEREAAAESERVESNPERLDFVASRLAAIYNLQQKHHVNSIAELIDLQANYETRLGSLEHGGEHISVLEKKAAECEKQAHELAERIGKGRRDAVPEVEKSVVEMLRRLGMPEAQLVVEVGAAHELRPNGGDEVRFLFTANGSVAPRPVEKIASGGEISRVMLALKTLSARSAGQPTVIFDEIDAGVSGRVADAMGEVIAELGRHCQVVNITHLPQIAAKPGAHFQVYKEGGSTHIRTLSAAERVSEIAKMLSGSTVTAAATKQAEELLAITKN